MVSDTDATSPTPLERAWQSDVVRGAAFVAFGVGALLCALNLRISALEHRLVTRRLEDQASVPSATVVRLLSLGHREWAADVLWSSALLYFGETLVTHQQQRYLQRYADAIEDVDPQFHEAYLWGATVSVYNARFIRRQSVDNAIRHLERGLRVFPDDGEMVYQLGFDEYFELPRLIENPEERTEMRRRGAEQLRRAAVLGYGPPWMALAAVNALESAGLASRAEETLRDLYLRTEDAAAREGIAQRIAELDAERGTEDPTLQAMRRFDAERFHAFPYMAPLLYLFVGPPVAGIVGAPRATVPLTTP